MKARPSQRHAARFLIISVVLLVLSTPFRTGSAAQQQSEARLLQHTPVKTLPSKEKRWALIVGIDEYEKDASSLKGAVNDAQALRDVLIRHAGFPESQIILLTSNTSNRSLLPTRANIFEALDSLTNRVQPDGLLLFSFSGHGVSIENEAYLVPSDGRITKNLNLLRTLSIDVNVIRKAIEETKVNQVLMLLDACRNEPGRGEVTNALTEAYKRGFSFDVANSQVKAFATLYAASIGGRAFEFLDRETNLFRGYFSHAVEEGLKGKAANERGEITLRGLTDYVDRVVPQRVRSGKGEAQEPSKEIAGYKENELILAIAAINPESEKVYWNSRAKIDPIVVEREHWETIRSSNDSLEYENYLKAYPEGAYAGVARAKIRQLEAAKNKSTVSPPVNERPAVGDANTEKPSGSPANTSFQLNIKVRADNVNNGWTNSGLVIRRGQQVRISAYGQVSLGKGLISSPVGLSSINDSEKLMRREPTGGVIAVIGDDNDDFIFIGAEREFTANRDGVLFLGVNEGTLSDNGGSYLVAIESQLLNVSNSTSAPAASETEFSAPITVKVRADDTNNGWTNSGLVVKRGQRIRITASGKVSLGPLAFSTPAGLPNLRDTTKLMRSQPTGALIAVIGDDNDHFIFIGTEGEFLAPRAGVLFLSVNEGNLKDNSGAYDAVVRVQRQ